ncbi:MAG TPA: hypothetical protein VHQ70_11510 [Syntrophomonadaceae bacterium]|nr:hypothetical protein [Syntrophomonadaceae bacterium]
MEVRQNVIIPLGYGKFVRSDKVVALEPIEEERGPGRRTLVYVESLDSPFIASRTETAILGNMMENSREEIEVNTSLELLKDIFDDLHHIGPMLRKSIKKEAQFDLDKLERRIEEILGAQAEERF